MNANKWNGRTDDLIWSVPVGFIISFVLYSFYEHGATIPDGLWGHIESVATVPFVVGMILSALISGNVHVFSLGFAFLINGLIYSATLFGLLRLRRKIWPGREV